MKKHIRRHRSSWPPPWRSRPLLAGAPGQRNTSSRPRKTSASRSSSADPAQPVELLIDNIFGGIDVQAADVATVEVSIRKTIKAVAQDRIAKAKAEVDLKITQKGNTVDLFVDGPFRDEERKRRAARWNDPGYIVVYEFSVKVPRRTRLGIKTVTEGDVAVRGVEGDFDVSNVNGKVTLDGIAGAGEADTVNGDLKAVFTRNPGAACAFKTVNGDVDLSFRDGLAADLRLKSMTGEALSDFAVTSLPAEPVKVEKRDGKTVYGRGGFTGVRVGKGGPEYPLRDPERRHPDPQIQMKSLKEIPMKKTLLRVLIPALLLAAAGIAGLTADPTAAPERLVVPLSKPGQPATFEANVMFGSIKISGYDGKDIVVEATARAKSVKNDFGPALAGIPGMPAPAAPPSSGAAAVVPTPRPARAPRALAFFELRTTSPKRTSRPRPPASSPCRWPGRA